MRGPARLFVLTLGFLIGIAFPGDARGQLIKSFSSFDGGTLRIDFGGLEKVGRRIQPCQMHQEIDPFSYQAAPPTPQGEPSPEILQGRALVEIGMRAFSGSRWEEAVKNLAQALTYLPGDLAVGKTLAAAQIGLRYEEQARRSDEESARREAEDAGRLGEGVERLAEALNALRLEASRALVDRGQFEAAVGLSARTDFVFDSSVVDLRQARQGKVDFEVLRPPVSREGQIEFSRRPRRADSPIRREARQLLDHPAVESVIFYERIGDALGYTPSEEERRDRYSDPVTRAVAERLNIDLRRATPEERALVAQKTREIWSAYDRTKARQEEETSEVARRSVQSFNDMLAKLQRQGILKPGEDLQAKEKSDPMFRAVIQSEVKAIVLEDDVGRRETTRNSFDRLLAEVGSILERKGKQ